MSRPGPLAAAGGSTDTRVEASLPRVRPVRAAARSRAEPWDSASGWGPHPDATLHRTAATPSPAPTPPPFATPTGRSFGTTWYPVAGAAGVLAPAPVPPTPGAPVAPAPVAPERVARSTPPASDPVLLPALAPRPDRPLTFVQRVTLMLQRLSRSQGRHRTGHSRHHWSMFDPHPAARRRSGGWARR